MADAARENLLQRIRQALGRSGPLKQPPTPPPIDEPTTRLVHMAIGLGELFAQRAQENHMQVELLYVDQVHERLIEFLRSRKCRSVAVSDSAFLNQLHIFQVLQQAGFDVRRSTQLAPDELYEIHCSITDVHCAVAEIGGLVLRSSPEYPRALSLLPPIHIAILQPAHFVPDLVDLFEWLRQDSGASETVIITGPAQTLDSDLNVLPGIHGPRLVQAYVLR